jgi:trk system potassium uptake protein TrkA
VNLLCCTTAYGMNPGIHTVARIRNPEYTEQIYNMRHIFGLSMAINPEKQAATEIERLLKFPGFLRREVFVRGTNEIVELRVDETSKLKDISLIEMAGIVKCKVLVCAVLRDGQAITPGGNFVLREGDRVFVTAPTENLAMLLKNLGIITRRVRHVMLCGYGRICHYLAASLLKSRISVTIVEKDPRRCQEAAAALPEANVILGDASDMELLASEGLHDVDALVTLTKLEELNIIISLQAIHFGVPQVITKLGHITNQSVINSLKLGSMVCPKDLVVSNILRYVRAMQNQTGAAVSLHHIADGQVEALEFLVDEHTRHCNTPLKDLKLKNNVLIAGITHGAKTALPNGGSTFQVGDTVMVVTGNRGSVRQLNDIFA